jgi:hypothetical protein
LDKKVEVTRAAKEVVWWSIELGSIPKRCVFRAISAMLSTIRREQSLNKLLERVGMFLKKVDAVLLGKYTRLLYDSLSWREARVLAQLHIGMARLNWYLHLVGVATSDQCPYRNVREMVEYFLFHYIK